MNNLKAIMEITKEEMSEILLRKMTVDMSIDFWQTKECAINSVDAILQYVLNEVEFNDEDVSNEIVEQRNYWRGVKEILNNK